MKKIVKRIIKIFIVLVVVAGLAGGGYWYYKTKYQKPVVLSEKYKTLEVKTGEVSKKITAEGKISTADEVSLYIETPQTVSKVNVKVGDEIKKDQVIAEYDISSDKADMERSLREAELNLANAKLNLKSISQPAGGNELLQYETDVVNADKNIVDVQNEIKGIETKMSQHQLLLDDAKKKLDNNKSLLDSGILSQSVYDQSELAYKSFLEGQKELDVQKSAREDTLSTRKTQKDYAKQRLTNAKNKFEDESEAIEYSLQENIIKLNGIEIERIKADLAKLSEKTVSPINGSVAAINIIEGQTATKGSSLVTISDNSVLIAKADISEYDAPLLEHDYKAEVTTSGLPGEIFTGKVTKISAGAVEKESSSDDEVIVPVEITLEHKDNDKKLKAGYSVDVEIFIERRENVLNLPVSAVLKENGKQYVYILADNTLTKTEVTTGLLGNKSVEILTGTKPGDFVVEEPGEVVLETDGEGEKGILNWIKTRF